MSPVIIRPKGTKAKMSVCSVSRTGIGLGQTVLDRAKWKFNDRIQVGWIEKAKCILLKSVASSNDGFQLGYADTRHKTGGRVQCKLFLRNYLQTLVELPKRNLDPIYLQNPKTTLALLLEEPLEWTVQEFNKAGANKIPSKTIGVYQLLGKGSAVLRVGQGQVKDRIGAHLKDPRFTPPTINSFQYIELENSEDAQLLEKILIAKYEIDIGVLPRFQDIKA